MCSSDLFEFFSDLALEKVINRHGVARPLNTACPFYVLLEYERPGPGAEAVLLGLIEGAIEVGEVVDAVFSQNMAQARALWRLREDISETIAEWTPYKNDISTSVSGVPALIESIEVIVGQRYPHFEVVWYGHIGDGNLHLNILKPDSMAGEEIGRAHV